MLAAVTILVWAVSGPIFHDSDTWQLVINTGTTIVTFLMVFLIQRAQNKDTLALHLELNEIIAAVKGANNRLIDVEDLPEEECQRLQERYQKIAATLQSRMGECDCEDNEGEEPKPKRRKAQRNGASSS